jgi:ABC-2 type transport system permease protein
MTRWRAFTQLILARVREFYREPEVIFWVYGFPILLLVVLGLAFSGGKPRPPAVDVQSDGDSTRAAAIAAILRDAQFDVEVHNAEECKDRLNKGKTALYLVPAGTEIIYRYDELRAESVLARHWTDDVLARHWIDHAFKQGAPLKDIPKDNDDLVKEPGSRYVHWLLPGLIGMNLMGGGLFGVGFVLVDMRVRRLFKRLMATPMNRGDFLMALLTSRLLFLLPEMAALLVIGWLGFGMPIEGSLLLLLLVILLGAYAFAGLGLLLGCRTEKTETMSAYINLVMLPSYLLSGVFFSSKRFPESAQPFIQALPLTQINDALREIMLEGAGLTQVGWRLGVLLAWGVVCFYLALRWFKWR